jgi:hypothetical protein
MVGKLDALGDGFVRLPVDLAVQQQVVALHPLYSIDANACTHQYEMALNEHGTVEICLHCGDEIQDAYIPW